MTGSPRSPGGGSRAARGHTRDRGTANVTYQHADGNEISPGGSPGLVPPALTQSKPSKQGPRA